MECFDDSAGYADITQEIAQKASCLAPKTFVGTLRTVKAALLPPSSPSKTGSAGDDELDPTAYATLIGKYRIGQPIRVEKWMKEAQAALLALPRFQRDSSTSRLAESGAEVRIAVFYWVCRAIKVRKSPQFVRKRQLKKRTFISPSLYNGFSFPFPFLLPTQLSSVQHVSLVDKHRVSLRVFNRLVTMMEDECVELKESICATIREMRKKKAASGALTTSKTPTSTPSHSRSASPTKSAMRYANATNSTPSLTNGSPIKRKVAFSSRQSEIVSASEDDEGIFALETPSKKRPRCASSSSFASSSMRVMPVSKAQLASASTTTTTTTSSSSEGEGDGDGDGEDVEMADAAVSTPSRPKRRLVAASPVAGPSTPRRPLATPTHAYRTPPSAKIQLISRLTDDEDDGADAESSEEEDGDEDTLPPSRRFRPVFLDRAQWAQRAPRLVHDRAAAERRTRELVGRWGHPFELLRRASAEVPAS